ncbi:MAG TPA: ATP-binding protein [Solirubrobacteraceae bacterium]|nr:ATP-binding protein [Solirubrobacteraceae bacterium]
MSVRRIPFRVRLTSGFAAVMILLFGGLALLLHARFEAGLDQAIDRALRTHAGDLQTLVRGERQLPTLPESGGAFAQVVDPSSGRVLAGTPDAERSLLTRPELRRAGTASGFDLINRGDHARLLAGPADTRSPAVLVVGDSLAQRNSALTTLSELLYIGGPMLLILTCLTGYGLAAWALAPVKKMSERADHIYGEPSGERLPVPEANDELHRLGETLNRMLSRIEDALARERAFMADAGHELRTPLAILKLELEFALTADSTREELQARLRSVAEEVDRLTKLAQDLLVIARAEQGRLPFAKRPIELQPLLNRLATRFATATNAGGRTVRLGSTTELVVELDPARLEQALVNMISNALRHGDGDVVLVADEVRGWVEIHVLDDGPGLAPDLVPRVFERFARADRAGSDRGAGLGLSIVEVIAKLHGGRAHVRNRPGGGADVWLELPGPAWRECEAQSTEAPLSGTAPG